MPIKFTNNKNKTNDTLPFKKRNYISFNSAYPNNYNPYVFKLKKAIILERGIVEDVKDGKLLISCRNRSYDLKVYFRRNVDQVSLVSKTHLTFGVPKNQEYPGTVQKVVQYALFYSSIQMSFSTIHKSRYSTKDKAKYNTTSPSTTIYSHSYPTNSSTIAD